VLVLVLVPRQLPLSHLYNHLLLVAVAPLTLKQKD